MDLEVASEFVLMASHLMFIKSRMLLSLEDEEARNEMDELIRTLQERQQKETYLKVKAVTSAMASLSEFGRNTFTRNPEPMERGAVYEYSHDPEDLISAVQAIFDRAERLAPPDVTAFEEIVHREPYPVQDKVKEIFSRLRNYGITRFLLLFRGSRTRSEIAATFIAVLEMCKSHLIRLAGSDVDCTVTCEKDAPEEPVL